MRDIFFTKIKLVFFLLRRIFEYCLARSKESAQFFQHFRPARRLFRVKQTRLFKIFSNNRVQPFSQNFRHFINFRILLHLRRHSRHSFRHNIWRFFWIILRYFFQLEICEIIFDNRDVSFHRIFFAANWRFLPRSVFFLVFEIEKTWFWSFCEFALIYLFSVNLLIFTQNK